MIGRSKFCCKRSRPGEDVSRAAVSLIVLALLAPPGVLAQGSSTPSTDQIIQQLTPRTRGMRNLTVEQAPAHESVRPSETSSTEGNTSTPAPGPASGNTAAAVQDGLPAERPSVSLLIHFGFDSARVEPSSRDALRNLAEAMRSPQLASASFSIEGHTDAKGSADYNQRLSQRRAAAVLDELTRLGVDKSRLSSVGKGFSEPANPNDPLDASNRRVRIVNMQ
jgi:OmpA-OmpF porin, OOP family